MNKTIIININGIVFHIEEDAYELLRSYMSEVKRHFAYSPDNDEIVTDIENRLAEMFNERLTGENKQVVVLKDVQDITAQMGSVNDFEITEEDGDYSFDKMGKKLFRDTEDRMIAGVCSGIGHYLDIEARWVRLFMLLITFIGGSGFMVYAILWIVMPKARTRTDRMAMKGKAINLQNFKKTFDEEIEDVRQGIKRVHSEASPGLRNMADALLKLVKILLKIIGSVLIFAEAMVLLGLIIGLTVVLGLWNSGGISPLPRFIEPEYQSMFAIGVFLSVSIPLISLLLLEIRLLYNRKVMGKTGAFIMLMLWLAGVGVTAFYGAKTGMEFTDEASFSQITDIKQKPVYFLKLNSEKRLTHLDSVNYNITPGNFKGRTVINKAGRDFDYLKNIDLIIERSDIDSVTLTQKFNARGSDFETALKNARSIEYGFKQTDSILYFDNSLAIGRSLFRGQEVKLVLQVPKNTKLIIDRGLNRYIRHYNLWDCQPESSASEWIMTESGLQCLTDSLKN